MPPATVRLAGLGDVGSETDSLPVVPAALLGLAALGLVAGGLAARRYGSDEPDPDGSIADPGDEAEPVQSPPVLTLVPLPRERAP